MNVAFIPVRGGSKSIPLKNIRNINGKPLVYWAIKAACGCDFIDKIYVSTDSKIIKETVENFSMKKVQVIDRSKASATDTASTESAMLEFAEQYDFDHIVLIQATSPLIRADDLNRGFELYSSQKYDSVFSAVNQKHFNWTMEEDGTVRPLNYNPFNRPRRQDYAGYYTENGAFYITSRERLIKSQCRMSGKLGICPMSSESFYEIDEPIDWIIIEELMKHMI